jgi:hypothetical protein
MPRNPKLEPRLIGVCAVLTCGFAMAQNPSEFAATDANLQACVARDSSNIHIMACNSVCRAALKYRKNAILHRLLHCMPGHRVRSCTQILDRRCCI